MTHLSNDFIFSHDVGLARSNGQPLVALESAVITHGLPRPDNMTLAQDVEREVRDHGAIPATVAVIQGKIHIGLMPKELEYLAHATQTRKISRRDFSIAMAGEETGGTTVAGTLLAASAAGLKVFATGGIGGVHRNSNFDISADLPELGRTPMVVVCAGAKAILDLPNTLEVLETQGVPVVGYQTDEFPAFYTAHSGLPVNVTASTPEEIARIATAHWRMGIESAILVVQPPPAETSLPADQIEEVILHALRDAEAQNVHGAAVTPFMLSRVSELSGGKSLQTNLALLRNNARLAAQIACALPPQMATRARSI